MKNYYHLLYEWYNVESTPDLNYNEVMLQANPEFTAWSNAFKAIANELGDKAFDGWTVSDVFEILSYTDNVYAHEDDIHRAVANGQRNYTRISRGTGSLMNSSGLQGKFGT